MVISYTNVYQFLYKIILLIGSFIALFVVFTIIEAIPNSVIDWIPSWLESILGIGIFIGTLVFAPMVYSKTIIPRWIPCWLYVRLNLGVPINTSEAEKVGFLFDGSMPRGQWYPLRGFRKIEQEFRREALFAFANRMSRQNGWKIPFPEYESVQANRAREDKVQDSRAAQQARVEKIIRESHQILGITEIPTTFDVVKMAYKRKISQYHPDKFAGDQPEVIRYAEETAKRLNGAYSILEKYYQTAS